MSKFSSFTNPAWRHPDTPQSPSATKYQPDDFPGCEPFHLAEGELHRYEGRLESWDGGTETAWRVCEPTSTYHEHPSRRLAGLVKTIAHVRGSPIEVFGTADLLVRDAHGERLRILQADETVYLCPRETRPRGDAIEVGSDVLPNVVLEVDNTMDVRWRKLGLYESWGFPEVWVEVPDEPSPSRPLFLRPGLTIHVLEQGGFHIAPSSRAFPGWTAAEIHRALNEPEPSGETTVALRRVGHTLGATEGTGPEDDPLLREVCRESHAEGYAEGQIEGWREERAERAGMVLTVLRARVIVLASDFTADQEIFGDVSGEALVAAALACTDEADFRRQTRDKAR